MKVATVIGARPQFIKAATVTIHSEDNTCALRHPDESRGPVNNSLKKHWIQAFAEMTRHEVLSYYL